MSEAPDLVTALDLRPLGPHTFEADNVAGGERGMVFGGELIAKMAVAAARADGAKPVKAAHGVFARTVQVDRPVRLDVDVLHTGRTFASATVSMSQRDRDCARALVLLSEPEEDIIRHAAPMPDVGGPDDAQPYGDPLSWREIRTVDGVDILDADSVGPPELYAWMRFRGAPDDLVIAQGLLAHATASYLIGTAMRLTKASGNRNRTGRSPPASSGTASASRSPSTPVAGS
jgi:acyl-CoA thioesterase II